ncbi:hypothetical protein QO259_10265 [Salinicola sp. JS01]|uniref:hypothetical protein n=1 Tax=Salinicola sp. JS01 TaxID=3050071 RepID=UPI00255C267B|nr:hypothetical protein [Salinicola sp. JS01]WIX31219.1 hypothetical protein QO259_10265 [Salinicola sp. JS01]
MSQMVLRLADLQEVSATPVGTLLCEMGGLGANQIAITVCDDEFNTLGGLVCLHGPTAGRYMAAIEAVTQEIEKENDRD